MATFANSSQRVKSDTTVILLSKVQHAVWQLGLPVLDANAVAKYKKRAKLSMLWREIRWPLLGMTVLVAFECLGRQWSRATVVGAAALLLAALFSWLVSASDLK